MSFCKNLIFVIKNAKMWNNNTMHPAWNHCKNQQLSKSSQVKLTLLAALGLIIVHSIYIGN